MSYFPQHPGLKPFPPVAQSTWVLGRLFCQRQIDYGMLGLETALLPVAHSLNRLDCGSVLHALRHTIILNKDCIAAIALQAQFTPYMEPNQIMSVDPSAWASVVSSTADGFLGTLGWMRELNGGELSDELVSWLQHAFTPALEHVYGGRASTLVTGWDVFLTPRYELPVAGINFPSSPPAVYPSAMYGPAASGTTLGADVGAWLDANHPADMDYSLVNAPPQDGSETYGVDHESEPILPPPQQLAPVPNLPFPPAPPGPPLQCPYPSPPSDEHSYTHQSGDHLSSRSQSAAGLRYTATDGDERRDEEPPLDNEAHTDGCASLASPITQGSAWEFAEEAPPHDETEQEGDDESDKEAELEVKQEALPATVEADEYGT